MAKKHHMTKHQYKAYEKDHRSRKHDDEEILESKLSGKMRSKDDEKVKNHLRHLSGHHLHSTATDLLEDEFDEGEEYEDNEDDMGV